MTCETDGNGGDEALRALAQEMTPPAGLEERVVASLSERGLLSDAGAPAPAAARWRAPLAVAACLGLVALGMIIGRMTGSPVPTSLTGAETDLYALLLYETDGYDRPSGAVAAQRYGEYSRWVADARRREQFVTGEDLVVERGWLLTPSGGEPTVTEATALAQGAPLSGIFFIRADDAQAALALARELPHLKHGGSVLVQKTQRTDVPPP